MSTTNADALLEMFSEGGEDLGPFLEAQLIEWLSDFETSWCSDDPAGVIAAALAAGYLSEDRGVGYLVDPEFQFQFLEDRIAGNFLLAYAQGGRPVSLEMLENAVSYNLGSEDPAAKVVELMNAGVFKPAVGRVFGVTLSCREAIASL